MRTRLFSLPLIFLLFCLAAPLRAQDATKILNQYVQASGGARALSKIQTLTLEGTVAAQNGGKPGAYTFDVKLPNRYYSEMVMGDQSWIEAFNGKSAWHQNAAGEISTLVGPEGLQVEAAARYYNSRLLNPKKNKLLITYVGAAQVAGRDSSQLEVTMPSGVQWQVFFDAQSHLIVKETALVGGVNQGILYQDYRAENGIQLPHKIELHRGSDTYSIDVTRAAVNEPIGERVFDFPRKSQVQLPDLKALFKQIDAEPASPRQNQRRLRRHQNRRRNGLRRKWQTQKTRRPRIHILLSPRHRSLHPRENQRPAAQRRRPEKGKRPRLEAD